MKAKKTLRMMAALLIILTVSAQMAMAGGQKEGQTPAGKPIELKLVTFGPLSHSNAAPMQAFMDRIKERSNGELIVTYMGATEVIPLYDQPEALRSGAIDLLVIFPAAYIGILPIAAGINLGNLDPPDWHRTGAHDYLVELHKRINMHYLGSFASVLHGSYIFLTKPISKPEELKGLQFATGPTNLLAVQAWGAGGVRVSLAEKYSALENGLVAGVVGDLDSQYSDSLYEVTKYWLPYSFGSALTCVLMNEGRWNELPEHLQKLVADVMLELERETTNNLTAQAKEMIRKLSAAGMKTIEFPPSVAANFLKVAMDAKWADVERTADPAEVAKLRDLLND